jgi:hypothetical protein
MEHNLVLAKMEWINFLYQKDIPVAKPFESPAGNI